MRCDVCGNKDVHTGEKCMLLESVYCKGCNDNLQKLIKLERELKECCDNCKFSKDTSGECRKRAPVIGGRNIYPQIDNGRTEWCGDFER